jgi:membrane-associated protein
MDFDFLVNLDKWIQGILQNYAGWTYAILFLIVFCETGLVITPFLPGDSLLFLTGTFAQSGRLNVFLLVGVFCSAALCGDNVNYFLGKWLGPKVFKKEKSRFFNKAHLEKTHAFFERYGGKTIILARFVPIVRTFAPFVAGMGNMPYRRFLAYSVAGAILWVGICVFGGYFFARSAFVKANFELTLICVVLISMLPGIIEFTKHVIERRRENAKAKTVADAGRQVDGL